MAEETEPTETPPDSESFTRADLESSKRAAKREAIKEVAAELGVPVAEAKAMIEAKRQADDAAKDEVTRARDEAAAAKLEAEQARREAASTLRAAQIERHLFDVTDPEARTLLMNAPQFTQLGPDAGEEAVAEAAGLVRDKFPAMFTGQSAGPPPATYGGSTVTTGRPPVSKPSTMSAMEAGAAAAKAASGVQAFDNPQPTGIA